jgi:hypothetical protein
VIHLICHRKDRKAGETQRHRGNTETQRTQKGAERSRKEQKGAEDGYGLTVATCRQTVDTQKTDKGGRVKAEDRWLFAEIVVLPGGSIKDLGAIFEQVLKHPLW